MDSMPPPGGGSPMPGGGGSPAPAGPGGPPGAGGIAPALMLAQLLRKQKSKHKKSGKSKKK